MIKYLQFLRMTVRYLHIKIFPITSTPKSNVRPLQLSPTIQLIQKYGPSNIFMHRFMVSRIQYMPSSLDYTFLNKALFLEL